MLKTYRKGLLTFITLTRVDTKVFTRATITMKTRLHLHLPQASDWLIASSELLVVDEVFQSGVLLWTGWSRMSTLMVGTQQCHRNNLKAILNPSLGSLIKWGSKPLLTVSTAGRSVLHSAEVAHFHHSSCKSPEELWTKPCMCWSGTIPHFLGVIA
jgi:hypothetical protein